MGAARTAGIMYILLGIGYLLYIPVIFILMLGILVDSYYMFEFGLFMSLIVGFLVAIFLMLSGIFSIPVASEQDVGTFTGAGVMLIIYSIFSMIQSILILLIGPEYYYYYTYYGLFFVLSMIGFVLALVAFILLGTAMRTLGNNTGDSGLSTAGLLIIIGAALLIIGIGGLLLLIGLFWGGSRMMALE